MARTTEHRQTLEWVQENGPEGVTSMPERFKTQGGNTALHIGDFARDALKTLANELVMRGDAKPKIKQDHIDQMFLAVTSPNRLRAQKVVRQMLSDGISAANIADDCIPRVAEMLGDAWCRDNIDFAATTIGSARLQGVLRALGPEWSDGHVFRPALADRYCVVVPENNQHTLGAMLIAGQLRRRQISVEIQVGRSLDQLAENLRSNRYDAILVSAYTTESLAEIGKIVVLAASLRPAPPVVVGGGLLDLNPNVNRLTGCDLATNDLDRAVAFCNNTKPRLDLAIE